VRRSYLDSGNSRIGEHGFEGIVCITFSKYSVKVDGNSVVGIPDGDYIKSCVRITARYPTSLISRSDKSYSHGSTSLRGGSPRIALNNTSSIITGSLSRISLRKDTLKGGPSRIAQ